MATKRGTRAKTGRSTISRMEGGRILEAMPWKAGRIAPDAGLGHVVFTDRVLQGDWGQLFEGRRVEFERYVGTDEAKKVVPR